MSHSAAPSSIGEKQRLTFSAASNFGLVELATGSPLRAQLLPGGAVFALRYGPTLINQLLPGPADNGLFRLLVRWRGDSHLTVPRHDQRGSALSGPAIEGTAVDLSSSGQQPASPNQLRGWAHLVGAGVGFNPLSASSAAWSCSPLPGLHCETRLELHPTLPAWRWRVTLRNASLAPFSLDLFLAQDLGLADEAAVRNNEAYTSHYIDLLPVRDDALGWSVLARQNQPMTGQHHPWLATACTSGAAAFCTDGWQFFGADHRVSGVPAAVCCENLPSRRYQYEFALAGLQSKVVELAPGAEAEVSFVSRFVDDHPAASSANDLDLVRSLAAANWNSVDSAKHFVTPADRREQSDQDASGETRSDRAALVSVFIEAPWLHGDIPSVGDWDAWFHGPRRHEEFGPDDSLWSFFHGTNTHVISREKEAVLLRPHGHILRSGDSSWFDADHFGLTCYAAGVFAAQAYLGHPSFARFLSVFRNALNVTRSSGQRVFLRRNGTWQQLGIPSAFVIEPGEVRWIYRFGDDVIEARVWCARELAASFLELRVTAGLPAEFLITHELVLGAAEFEFSGTVESHHDSAWISCEPARESLVGQHQPGVCFAIAFIDPDSAAKLGGDDALYPDENDHRGPYVTLRTEVVEHCGVILLGSTDGASSLDQLVTKARRLAQTAATSSVSPVQPPDAAAIAGALLTRREVMAAPPLPPLRLTDGDDPGVARIDEILPWFTHNASIHFSAPHGLEQYGGAAWGVRDVCQGSVEWLLAAGEFRIVRCILETVFAQQYPRDGSWPQWFMFPPYRFIQQAHSHGDVCFWPVKALCDYLEASNDLDFLSARVGYTAPTRFESCGPEHTLLEHCDLVIAQTQARFLSGTSLVNYGDGDWDDTLQPADPAMRTRMISGWTVALAFQTFRQLAAVCRRAGHPARAAVLTEMLGKMRQDFAAHLMPSGVVAGFVFRESDERMRPLLHPEDEVTRIRYRLLPMTRSILAELFTKEEARRHLSIISSELLYPDGVRLMSEPATYGGGLEQWFKRADTAANVGREIGLQYVHAHLRYAEALAKVGDADGLWHALQVVNPVALAASVPHAAPRQSNSYFSSSDADFADRYEAAERWTELRTGAVAVRGGWRIYSSGPGIFLHVIRASLLGVRESFDDIVFDPVLPRALDGLSADTVLLNRAVALRYKVRHQSTHQLRSLVVNGTPLDLTRREPNPYRAGGVLVSRSLLTSLLRPVENVIELEI